MARQILFVFILLYLCVNSIKSDEDISLKRTLHIYKDNNVNLRGKRTIVINADESNLSDHVRHTRDTSETTIRPDIAIINGNITVKVRFYQDF